MNRLSIIQNAVPKNTTLLITNFYNILYLSGFQGINPMERESIVLIDKKKAFLFLPSMYAETAKKLKIVQQKKIKLILDHERDGLFFLWKKYVPKDAETVWFEEHDVTVGELRHLQKNTDLAFAPEKPLFIETFRSQKEREEISFLQKATEITDETFNQLLEFLKKMDYEKYTEKDIAFWLETTGRKLGAQGLGFPSIVACGKGSSEPHYVPQDKHLQKGQPLLVDFGMRYYGYTADLSRTLFLGRASKNFKKIYQLVLMANEKALALCQVGQQTEKIIKTVNKHFQKHRVFEKYLHGLGHGVGLEVHEQPFLRGGNQILTSGMVITIEPGLYFPKKYGIRIEDVVHIRKKGHHILSKNSPKNLIEII